MATEDNPTGIAYLKTYQALFQMVEILFLLIAWSLLASEEFVWVAGFGFALGTFVTIWLILDRGPLFFFVCYITGLHTKVQNLVRSRKGTTSGTAENLAPPPEAGRFLSGSAWFVAEYIIYLICVIFLFVAVCIVSSNTGRNGHFIASATFAWFSLIVFILHFCLLVRNTEGIWPHQCMAHCCQLARKSRAGGESAGLLPGATAPLAEP